MDNDHGITDELRRYASYAATDRFRQSMLAIADRIDAAHEEAIQRKHESAYDKGYDEGFASADDWLAQHEDAMAEHGWVKLPVDADGKPWHIGDFTESGQLVYKMYLDVNGWSFYGLVNDIDPSIHRHYHEPTVEDVLRGVVTLCHNTWKKESPFHFCDVDDVMKSGNIAEFAAKLRLAGDAE